MRLWEVFYDDDMKGRNLLETAEWCFEGKHWVLASYQKEYDALMVRNWNECIDKVMPLPQELVDWWYRKYDKLGGYREWNSWGLSVGLRMYFPSDWNKDRGDQRWRKPKDGSSTASIQTREPNEELTLDPAILGPARTVWNGTEKPLNVSIVLEPYTSVQVTWKK
jgi:hypothetical protein